MAVASPVPSIVGALSCQKDSYLQTLRTEVVSCLEYVQPAALSNGKAKNKRTKEAEQSTESGVSTSQKTWLIELADSVLFPEGGGQPTDHGSIVPLNGTSPEAETSPIPITKLERHGLRCIHFSPSPLSIGTPVLQTVNYTRRWDHMQQHTGQHLLSAILDTLSLPTLSWSMGAAGEMNSIELPRKPTAPELATIQTQCNEAIRANHPITILTPSPSTSSKTTPDRLPADYDKENGVVRFIQIGQLDSNACCGTHLKQTSHISLLLVHHTQTVRATNCRLFFSAGDRAIELAATSINALRAIALPLSSGSAPAQVIASVQRLGDVAAEAKKREKKLLAEVARYEGERIMADLQAGSVAWCYRAGGGLDFIHLVVGEVKDGVAERERAAVVLVSGEVKTGGNVVILGDKGLVESLAGKVKELVGEVKGGGKGKWQGKVVEWKKGEIEALRVAVGNAQ